MFTQGARRTCASKALTSRPNACPIFSTSEGFHVAAKLIPEGNAVDFSMRTPNGPSVILSSGIPRRAFGFVANPVPPSISIFSSSVIRFSKSSTLSSTGSFGFLYGGKSLSLFPIKANSTIDNKKYFTLFYKEIRKIRFKDF